MTYAPATLVAARKRLLALDMHPGTGAYPADLDPDEIGIVGDTSHVQGGTSYHLGKDDLDLAADPYSARTARDKAGLTDAASAMDIGEFRVTTPKGTFTQRDFAIWLVKECQANAPDTSDIREVIYSPDGKVVLRYDRERGYTSAPRTGEADSSHITHDHASLYRDAEKRYSMLNLINRWLASIGFEGGTVTNIGDIGFTQAVYPLEKPTISLATMWLNTNAQSKANGAALSAQSAQLAGLVTTVQALADALKSGGNDLDTAAVLARIDQRAQENGAMVHALQQELTAAHEEITRLHEALAAAAHAEADALG